MSTKWVLICLKDTKITSVLCAIFIWNLNFRTFKKKKLNLRMKIELCSEQKNIDWVLVLLILKKTENDCLIHNIDTITYNQLKKNGSLFEKTQIKNFSIIFVVQKLSTNNKWCLFEKISIIKLNDALLNFIILKLTTTYVRIMIYWIIKSRLFVL